MKLTAKLAGSALIASAAFAAPVAANAATITTISANAGLHTASYARTLTYTVPAVQWNGLALQPNSTLSVFLSSVDSGGKSLTNLDFVTATLSGTRIVKTPVIKKGVIVGYKNVTQSVLTPTTTNLKVVSSGTTELRRLLDIPVIAGDKFTLKFAVTSQKYAKYTASWVLGVPEASTWALMVLGFGAVAYSMRRRSATQGRLAIA